MWMVMFDNNNNYDEVQVVTEFPDDLESAFTDTSSTTYFSLLLLLSASGRSGFILMSLQSACTLQRCRNCSDRIRTVTTLPPAPISTMATRGREEASESAAAAAALSATVLWVASALATLADDAVALAAAAVSVVFTGPALAPVLALSVASRGRGSFNSCVTAFNQRLNRCP